MTYSQKAGASKKLVINTEQQYNNTPVISYSKTPTQKSNGQQYYTPRNEYQNQQFQIPTNSQPLTARNRPRIFEGTVEDMLNRSGNNGYSAMNNKESRSPSPFNQTMPSNVKVLSSKEVKQQQMEASRSKSPNGMYQPQQVNKNNFPQFYEPQFYQPNGNPNNFNNQYYYSNQQGPQGNNYYPPPNFQNERLQNMQYNSGNYQQASNPLVKQQKAPYSSNSTSSNDLDNPRESQRQGYNENRGQLDASMASSKSRRTKPIVVMNINVGPTQKEEIKVYEGDDPSDVALKFCQKYGLDPKVSKVLEKNIKAQCDKFYQMLEEKKSTTSFAASHQSSMKNVDFTQIPSRNSSNREEQENQSKLKPYGLTPKGSKPPVYAEDDEDPPYKPRRSLSSKAPKTDRIDEEPNEVQKEFNAAKNKIYGKMKTDHWNYNTKKPTEKRYSTDEENSTFHPEVNQKSAEMASDRGNVYEYLAKDANAKQERYQKTQMLKEMHELDGHTFHPQINDQSRKLVNNNQNRSKTPVHEKLYGDALARKNTIESVSTEDRGDHTFAPKINEQSKRIAESKGKQEQVYNRLYQEKDRYAENLEKKRREAEKANYIDPKTGQRLFQPTIDRTSSYYQKAANRVDAAYVEEVVEVDPEEYYDQINQTYDGPSQMTYQDNNRSMNKSMNRQAPQKEKSKIYDQYQSSTPKNNNPQKRDISPLNYGGAKDNSTPRGKPQQQTKPQMKGSPVDPNSLKGFNLSNIERELLADVFKSLDGDGDGRISNNDVDLSAVHPEILDTISDVLVTLDDNVALNFKDFVNMINHQVVLKKLREIHNIPPKSQDDESNPSDYSDNAKNQGYSDDHDGQSTSEVSDYAKENEKEKLRQQRQLFENMAKKNEPPLTKHYKQLAKRQ